MISFKKVLFVLGNYAEWASSSFYKKIHFAASHGASITILKVFPDYSLSFVSNLDVQRLKNKYLAQEKAVLDDISRSFDHAVNVSADVVFGKRYLEVIRQVQHGDFDLVIKDVDRLDWLERLIGSDDMHLLRKCPCPVWLLSPANNYGFDNIVVALSLETNVEQNSRLLDESLLYYSASLAISSNAKLHILNVVDVPEIGIIRLLANDPEKAEKDILDSASSSRRDQIQVLLEKLEVKLGKDYFDKLSIQKHIVQGIPDQKIPEIVTKLKADLVVMGTISRVGIAGVIIGNTAENVLSQINTSVLTIKPAGFKAPM